MELAEITMDPSTCGSAAGSQDISTAIGRTHMDSSSSHGDTDLCGLHTVKRKVQAPQ